MAVQRNLNRWVDGDPGREMVRRTISEMDQRLTRLEQMLTRALSRVGNENGGLTPQQQSDVAGLIGALSQSVIGTGVSDPVLPGQIGGGTVISVTAGSGLSGGAITTSGTIALLIGTANVIQKSNGVRLVDSRIVDDGNDISLNTTKKVFFGTTPVMTVSQTDGLVILDIGTLPTADPGVPGALWNNLGVINVSP